MILAGILFNWSLAISVESINSLVRHLNKQILLADHWNISDFKGRNGNAGILWICMWTSVRIKLTITTASRMATAVPISSLSVWLTHLGVQVLVSFTDVHISGAITNDLIASQWTENIASAQCWQIWQIIFIVKSRTAWEANFVNTLLVQNQHSSRLKFFDNPN